MIKTTDYNGVECPRCHKSDKFAVINENNKKFLKCERCNFEFINNELDVAYGIRRCPDGTFETESEKWQLFACEYCMVFFLIYDEYIIHKKENHKVGDYMRCMEV